MTNPLSSNFFQFTLASFFVLFLASIANAQCLVSPRGDESWANLPVYEAAFIRAAEKADGSCLIHMLEEEQVNINVQDDRGNTAVILLASRPGIIPADLVKKLVTYAYIDLTIRNNGGLNVFDMASYGNQRVLLFLNELLADHSSTFLDSIANRNIQAVQRAINFGVDPNIRHEGPNGETALMVAARARYLPVAEAILNSSTPVDINYQLDNGETALMIGVHSWHMVDTLLEREDIDVNIEDLNDRTALIHAVFDRNNSSVRRLLQVENIDVNVTDVGGETALLAAKRLNEPEIVNILKPYVSMALHKASIEGDVSTVNSIISQIVHDNTPDANTSDLINSKDSNGNTPLMNAVLSESESKNTVVRTLISASNIDLNASNQRKETALLLAARVGDSSAFRQILSSDKLEDVNARDRYDRTALMNASLSGALEIVNQLLTFEGTNIGIRNRSNESAKRIAERLGHSDIVAVLEEAEIVAKEKFFEASRSGDMEALRLYQTGFDINIREENRDGSTALINAARSDHTSMVEELLKFPNIDVNAKSYDGSTALTAASQLGHADVVNLLINNVETHLDVFGKQGRTAFMWAAISGNNIIIINNLMAKNADLTLEDKERGFTALMFAAQRRKISVLERILPHKDVGVSDIEKAMEVTRSGEVLDLLEQHRLDKMTVGERISNWWKKHFSGGSEAFSFEPFPRNEIY